MYQGRIHKATENYFLRLRTRPTLILPRLKKKLKYTERRFFLPLILISGEHTSSFTFIVISYLLSEYNFGERNFVLCENEAYVLLKLNLVK